MAIFYLSKFNSVEAGMSRTSAISNRVSKDMEVGMFGASILLVGCGSADITGSWTYKGEVVEFLSDGTLFYDGCSDMHPPVYEITDEGYLKIGKYDYAWIAYEYTYFIIDINGNTLTLTDKTNADRVYVLERQ